MKNFFYVIIFAFNIYLNLLLQAQNLTYKSLPKNLTVTLNYWQQINGFFAYNEKLPDDCNIKSTIDKSIIICPVWVKIIINKKQLLSWQQQQNKNGFINLYLPKIGILHEKAKITKIKKVIPQKPTNKNQHLVTAVYMRYAHVLIYKIKDVDTGKMSEITVTPEHKFYETTYNKFMAISKLGLANTITNTLNHHLKIICDNNKQNNCGTAPLNSLQKVYNMEVEKTHNYFVGNMGILVHNGCYDYYYRCLKCKESHAEKFFFIDTCEIAKDKKHLLRMVYQCELCGYYAHQKTQKNHHVKFHKSNGLYACGSCNGKFNSKSARVRHEDMHRKNGNKVFCRECDEFVSLKDTSSKEHRHKPYTLSYDAKRHNSSRDRPISPIVPFSNFSINFILGLD